MYRFLMNPNDEFDIIRANIVIRALMNKNFLDETILYAFRDSKLKTEEVKAFVNERRSDLPFIQEDGYRVYLPIFSRSINEVYDKHFGKLLTNPYGKLINDYQASTIDLFEVYNFELYDSVFTKLICVYKSKHLSAYYHFDFRMLYFVNDQGRLDIKIALFDRYLMNPNFDHILTRLKEVANAYLNDNREDMLNALLNNGFISGRLYEKIIIQDEKYLMKRYKYGC